MKFIGVRQSLEEEEGFWNVHWDIRRHIDTTKSNILAGPPKARPPKAGAPKEGGWVGPQRKWSVWV